MHWHVGTIGFSYPDWQPAFYPKSVRAAEFLATYAAVFNTVELDTTFHAIPPVERVQKWADSVPKGFIFCPKTPRQITHDAPISLGLPAMRQFLRTLDPMRRIGKLGPVLLQFPPTFRSSELPHLRHFLSELPTEDRFAVELRHGTWRSRETEKLLREFHCAWVAGDYAIDPLPIRNATDFLYTRFIGIHGQYADNAREQADRTERLIRWRDQIMPLLPDARRPVNANTHDDSTPNAMPRTAGSNAPGHLFAFFSNDYAGHAPATANRFRTILGLPAAPMPQAPVSSQGSLF